MHESVHRVQFKLLMDLLMQYGDSLTLTRWIAGALLKRTVVMQLGNWSSALHRLTMGLPQGSPLSRSVADLNQDSHSGKRWLIYKSSENSQEAAEAMQQLDSVSQWCHDTGSLISPDKAQTLWYTLDRQTNASGHTGWNCSRTNKLAEIPWNRL